MKKENPLSTSLTNSAGIDDRYTCPACYEDHVGYLDGEIVECDCGWSFSCELISEPVCKTELIQ